jgi:hypothetical protein
MICHAPVDSDEEQSALRVFIEEVALARTGSPVKILSYDARRSAKSVYRPPQLAQHARLFRVDSTKRPGRHSTTTSVTP